MMQQKDTLQRGTCYIGFCSFCLQTTEHNTQITNNICPHNNKQHFKVLPYKLQRTLSR